MPEEQSFLQSLFLYFSYFTWEQAYDFVAICGDLLIILI